MLEGIVSLYGGSCVVSLLAAVTETVRLCR